VAVLRLGRVPVVNVLSPPEMLGNPGAERLDKLVHTIAPPPTNSPTISSANTIQPMRIPDEGDGTDGGGIGCP
jgi:hypothetical protein